jgi:hypothetical protein
MGKDTLASYRTLFFTSNAMAPHTQFPAWRLLTIPSIRLLLLLRVKPLKLPTSPSARRGTYTSSSAQSHATNSRQPLTMCTEVLNTISLRDLVTHICSINATISQPNVDNNTGEFAAGIKPSLPVAVYTHKQEKCQTFAQDAGVPISEATMVTTGTKAALNCGGMELA